MSYTCEICKNSNMAVIERPQSKEDIKKGQFHRFVICRVCEPLTASFEWLENGYDDLKNAIKKARE